MNTGSKIRSSRTKKGLTQIQLAERAGVSVNTIRLYEGNKVEPKIVTLRKIACALGVYVGDLVDAQEWKQLNLSHAWDDFDSTPKTNVQLEISAALGKLNDEGQAKALERVKELTEIPRYQIHTDEKTLTAEKNTVEE